MNQKRPRGLTVAAISVLAIVFGVLTIREGGSVLFGDAAARATAGRYVPFVLWFNFLAGFAYVIAGTGLWLQRRWALWLSVAILLATLITFAAFGAHVYAGGAYEPRTLVAMSLRTLIWAIIVILARRSLRQGALLACFVLLCVAPATTRSDTSSASVDARCSAHQVIRFRGASARLENDLFVGTDQNYSNGLALTLISHDLTGPPDLTCLPWPVRLHARLIGVLNPQFWVDAADPVTTQNVVVKFGQSIYTPRDYSRRDLIADDRPYAGLLYLGASWNQRRRSGDAKLEILDTREFTLGVIGPWSLAEQTQNIVHDAVGAERFLGWSHQLSNEPALQLAFDRKFRTHRSDGAIIPGFSADSIRSFGFRLGNIETSATLGLEARIGWNIPNDFGSYPIRPGAENRPPSSASAYRDTEVTKHAASSPRPGLHFFTTLEAKLVAHDFSLDGNLLRSGPGVERRPWVAQAAVGISAHRLFGGHGVRLALMHVYRTREFAGQLTDQAYGSIALSWEFQRR